VQPLGRGGSPAASASRIRVAGLVLLIAHLTFAGWMALRPLSVPWVAPANLVPFATIRSDLDDGSDAALAGLGGGLALLAPLGVLLPLAAGWLERSLPGTWVRTVACGTLISSVIMLLESSTPGHIVNVDSVVLNTTGVALSCLLVFAPLRALLLRVLPLRHGDGDAAGSPAEGPSYGPGPSLAALHRREDANQGAPRRPARVGIAP
jgi:VanZ like family